MDEEQPVSMVTAGPSKPYVYDRRPEAMLEALPVMRWPASCSWAAAPPRRTW
ncbi:hypothetical protein EES44_14895 [Streptomyces sp. ADI96-15]|nr:hypothetical protein EES44_14895 [Streptomyces sp. ADI96-15]